MGSAALLLLLLLPGVGGIVNTYSVRDSGPVAEYARRDYGLARGAEVRLDYDLSASQESPPVFFSVISAKQKDGWYDPWWSSSIAREEFFMRVCNLPAMRRWQLFPTTSRRNLTYVVERADLYSFVYTHCDNATSFDLDFRLKLVNPDPDGRVTQHLPIEDVNLPLLYGALLVVHCFMLAALLLEVWQLREMVRRIHLLLGAALALRIAFLAAVFTERTLENRDGTVSEARMVATRELSHFSDTAFLAAMLLLSTGWTLTRQFINVRELNFINTTFLAYLVIGAVGAPCGVSGGEEGACPVLELTLNVLRSLVLLCIIVSLNFNVTHIRGALSEVPWNSDVPVQYARLKQFQLFRWVFLAYLLLPMAFLTIEVTMLSWKYQWINVLLDELLLTFLYLHVGAVFRPMPVSPLVRAFDGSLATVAAGTVAGDTHTAGEDDPGHPQQEQQEQQQRQDEQAQRQ